MRKYFGLLIESLWDSTNKDMVYDVSQHRRYTTRYEDLCM